MEDGDEGFDLAFGASLPRPPAHVSLSPYASSIPRCLSSCFSQPTRPVSSSRKLAWVSLQGRLVGADEAASAGAVGGGLSREVAVAWELFSPLHRVLIVAVVAVAAAESKKSWQIGQLRRSVDVRDQVLLSMQQKLDDFCEQMNPAKDQLGNHSDKFYAANDRSMADEVLEPVCGCGRQICELNPKSGIVPLKRNPLNGAKDAFRTELGRDEMFMTTHENWVEQEERRMSDLSDLCSVTSSMDIQLSALVAEKDIYNLRKECEEKDAVIKELGAAAHASNVVGFRRIRELEDIIRRKNMVITKLKKDMAVLEQKVVQLTRLRRPSFTASNSSNMQLPMMSNNLLYDMSSTSPSSSDSDCPAKNRECQTQSPVSKRDHDSYPQDCIAIIGSKKTTSAKAPVPLGGSAERLQQQRTISPLKENRMTHKADSPMVLRPRQSVSSGGVSKPTRKHIHQDPKRTTPRRRWV